VNCQQACALIHAYSDGELDLVTTLDIEQHIRDCADCSIAHRNLVAIRSSIVGGSLYFRAPASLDRTIRSQVKQARAAAAGRWAGAGPGLAAAAAIAVVAATLWLLLRSVGGRAEDLLASEVTSAHIRSLMADHLWDVKSTDQHTVKPWFDGKVDFAPQVRDFRADSYSLEGGRLDYLANRPVAALVYRHEKHYINLFIWPAPGQPDQDEVVSTHQGYLLIHWLQSGMNYWAVSDMSEIALRHLVNLVEHPDSPSTKPMR
jgi:anti-sigma factor RsiW